MSDSCHIGPYSIGRLAIIEVHREAGAQGMERNIQGHPADWWHEQGYPGQGYCSVTPL